MMVMEKLAFRQKQEWKSGTDSHWVRTGCSGLWDAVLTAFRDYRDAPPASQLEMIRERTGLAPPQPSEEWVGAFHEKLKEGAADREEVFFHILPKKLLSQEIIPYMQRYIQETPNLGMGQLHEEIVDKCFVLAEYRQTKKNLPYTTEELRDLVRGFLHKLFREMDQITQEDIQQAMERLEHQLVLLTPQEKVLFATQNPDGGYQDVVLVLAHPDNTYDSIGRISYTKDGHQKISRLFHYDDEAVEALRKNLEIN
jgi:hypothetical protein